MVESLWLRSGEKEEGGRKGGRKEGRTALIKSNNPHLAGDGECFNAMVGITRSKVIADVFRLSDAVLNSKMSTVTRIAEGRLAILVTVHVFGLSHLLGNSKVSPHLQNI